MNGMAVDVEEWQFAHCHLTYWRTGRQAGRADGEEDFFTILGTV